MFSQNNRFGFHEKSAVIHIVHAFRFVFLYKLYLYTNKMSRAMGFNSQGKMKPSQQYFQLFSSNAGSIFAIESGNQEIVWC